MQYHFTHCSASLRLSTVKVVSSFQCNWSFLSSMAVDFSDFYSGQPYMLSAVFVSRKGTPHFHLIIADLHLCLALLVGVLLIRYFQSNSGCQGLLCYMVPQFGTLLQ